jgi:protein-disulfide isomerase-like protein with CxxC motif
MDALQTDSCVIPQFRGLLAIANLGVTKAEQQLAQQQKRIQQLQTTGLPTLEAEKTLDVMVTVASAMRDQQLMIRRLFDGETEH